jgi:KUP system potassium uptake protein
MTAETADQRRSFGDAGLASLSLTSLGVVYGDLGTSPLYTMKTVVELAGGTLSADTALGLLSLLVWTLVIITSIKYVSFVMRVDNDGEGGILALMSLLGVKARHRPAIIAIGLFGAALIYGDGAITPAISVLSALEGLKIATPNIGPYVLPLTVAILVLLFAVQSQGTARIGKVFGPIMVLWFLAIGLLGLRGVIAHPTVLRALNPLYAIDYLAHGGYTGFLVLGGVFLCVTGAEALYADMGHVGARAIRTAWYGLVLPALLLNYAGQAGLVLAGEPIADNIFYRLCPAPVLVPMIALATVATIIASQSIITGAFSMTRQAMLLGWCPPLQVRQTSSTGYGQIYVPAVNWLLMIVTVGLALGFGSSDNLAAAYGIAVSLTMLLTTVLLFVAMREVWRWPPALALAVAGLFFCIDAGFVSANLVKVREGGWVPLALAVVVYLLLTTWHRGIAIIAEVRQQDNEPLDQFLAEVTEAGVARVPGTAVFLTRNTVGTPPVMAWYVKHIRALRQDVVVLTVLTESVPWLRTDDRASVEHIGPGLWRVIGHYGFMERRDVPALLRQARIKGCMADLDDVIYYIGRETILPPPGRASRMGWRGPLFAAMQRNAAHMGQLLRLPRDDVIEIGREVEL